MGEPRSRLIFAVSAGLISGTIGFTGVWYGLGTLAMAPAQRPVLRPMDLAVEGHMILDERGNRLRGWVSTPEHVCAVSVLLHGIGGNRRQMLSRAQWLQSLGVASAMFDFQAHGESDGNRITFGYLEMQNAVDAMRFAREKFPGKPLIAVGMSLGGAALIMASDQEQADLYVVEASYSTLFETVRARIQTVLPVFTELQTGILLLQLKPRLGFTADQLRPVDQIPKIASPILILAGDFDDRVPMYQTRALFNAARSTKRLHIFSGAGHFDFHHYDREKYENIVSDFVESHTDCKSDAN